MPVLNEDTFALMCLIEQNDALYDDCFRITVQALEGRVARGEIREDAGEIVVAVRAELSATLSNVLCYCDDESIQDHLGQAVVDWRDVAREFIADVLFSPGREA